MPSFADEFPTFRDLFGSDCYKFGVISHDFTIFHQGRDGHVHFGSPCQASPLQLAAVRPGQGALEHVPGLCALLRPNGPADGENSTEV